MIDPTKGKKISSVEPDLERKATFHKLEKRGGPYRQRKQQRDKHRG